MTVRRRLRVDGIVQGVGFRPFVHNLATQLGLAGSVANTSVGVFVEIQGPPADLDAFVRRLREDAPPLAVIDAVAAEAIPPRDDGDFVILPSEDTPGTATLVPPDVALCDDCRREIRDVADRRHRYPFTNCTNCGPRWTIIDRIPYDRPFTSMAPFAMCPACAAEYGDPRDRRFHAQPNACPACGPALRLEGPCVDPGPGPDDDPLATAADLLVAGHILAVKGLGGFHLAVRADDEAAVNRLRERKGREGKPLAVMTAVPDALAVADDQEHELLTSPAAPIVLLLRRRGAPVAPAVAPGHRRLGVMLPYTPLHALLCDELADRGVDALVLTSGNASDEPICLDDAEARRRLDGVADAWLGHDRAILRRADDSVVQLLPDGPLLFRRSRGHVPVPLTVADDGPVVLAAGADLKNTVAVLKGRRGFLSPHVGDLENLATHDFFRETIRTLSALLESEPAVLACDRHPAYLSSRWAREEAARRGLPLVEVQHHHAHLVATAAEHGLAGPVVGLILDGTGWGDDGTIWGGEILVGDAASYERAGHLAPVPLPGGDAAVRAPWRTALSYLVAAHPEGLPRQPWFAERPVAAVREQIDRGVNAPPTSSAGRLCDAFAALTGRWGEVRYEAQAAIELMAAADVDSAREAAPYPWDLRREGGRRVLDFRAAMREAAVDPRRMEDPATYAAVVHRSLADGFVAATAAVAAEHGLGDVVLGGGVFQNEILIALVGEGLAARGLRVHRPRALPPNDGGLALGQAVAARAALA